MNSTPKPPPLCQATWWHVEEQKGQRIRVNHLCGRPAGHSGWHTCQFHRPVDRTMPGGARVTEGSNHG